MRKNSRFITLLLVCALILTIVGCADKKAIEKKPEEAIKIFMATGAKDGAYHNIGQAFSNVLKKEMIDVTVLETAGSRDNIEMLLKDKADLGISMLDVATEAYKAKKTTSGSALGEDLRVMMPLYANTVQLVTTEDTKIKTFEDLKYKRVGVGAENSGEEWNARLIFEAYGMTYKDCDIEMVDPKEAFLLMQEGKLDAAFVTGTVPNEMIAEMEKDKKHKLVFIPISGESRNALISKYPFFKADSIPADSYGKNLKTDTVSVMNMLLVNKNTSDKTVEKILSTIEKKLPELEAAIGSDEMFTMESPEALTKIPMHPAAKTFFDKNKN